MDLFTWIATANDATYRLGATPLAVYRTWSTKVTAGAGRPALAGPAADPRRRRAAGTPGAGAGLHHRAEPHRRGACGFENLVTSLLTGKRQSSSTLLTLTRIGAPDRNSWPLIAQRILSAPQAAPAPPSP